MDQETMLHHLEELADKLGIEVRYESAAGRVGVGMLRGRRVAVIDANLRVNDRVAALSSILSGEQINGVFVPPAVRQRIDASAPLRVRPKPGGAEERDAAPAEEVDESFEAQNHSGADPEADADR